MDVLRTTVFAAGPGGGNPCPVVLDAWTLDAAEMQAVARKHGQESGFVVSQPGAARPQLRFFVPEHEMSMCVHATIACTQLLRERGELDGDRVTYETGVGSIDVSVGADGLIAVAQRVPVASARNPSPDELAAVMGVDPKRIVGPAESWSASRAKLVVPLADRETLDALAPDWEALWSLCDAFETTGVYAIAEEDGVWCARQFPSRAGYPEDAATGVAAAALGGYLAAHRPPQGPGTVRHVIRQGEAMGRPSRLSVAVDSDGAAVTGIRVEGRAEVLDG